MDLASLITEIKTFKNLPDSVSTIVYSTTINGPLIVFLDNIVTGSAQPYFTGDMSLIGGEYIPVILYNNVNYFLL